VLAEETVCTLVVACSVAADTDALCRSVRAAFADSAFADRCRCSTARLMLPSMVMMVLPKPVEPSALYLRHKLWALSRELRGLWQARERDRLRSSERGSGWNLAATPAPRALSRIRKLPLARLLVQAGHTDRVIKGLAAGDAWSALTGLTGSLAGALQATVDSGRVRA